MTLEFVLDKNLGSPIEETPWKEVLQKAGIDTVAGTDLVKIDGKLAADGPEIAYVPVRILRDATARKPGDFAGADGEDI